MLSLAVSFGWPLCQFDVSNAFLHGHLSETVYTAQPPGFSHPQHPHVVCKLQKAIYGLKRTSFLVLLIEYKTSLTGFHGSKIDSSLFIFNSAGIRIFSLIYVDDIILTGSSNNVLSQLIATLSHDFPIKDLGNLNFFLGVEVIRTAKGLLLSQQRYISDLLHRTKMTHTKPVHSSMSSSTSLSKFMGSSFSDKTLYRSTVEAFQYLSFTRLDIAFFVNKVAQFMHDPRNDHWSAVKRILRYLKNTVTHGLFISKCSSMHLSALSNANWAGCPNDRKSTFGYCIYLGSNLISWS